MVSLLETEPGEAAEPAPVHGVPLAAVPLLGSRCTSGGQWAEAAVVPVPGSWCLSLGAGAASAAAES